MSPPVPEIIIKPAGPATKLLKNFTSCLTFPRPDLTPFTLIIGVKSEKFSSAYKI